jgi:CubicO group peptidase (beta-lactamase class C family)
MIMLRTALLTSLMTLAAASTTVDLSTDLEVANTNNPGAGLLSEVLESFPEIRTGLVLEHGRIVAEYVRDDVDPNKPWDAWSVTKSWMSLIIGKMAESNLLSLDETLFEIWPDESIWTNVTGINVDFRKNVTIESLLTMSSGLINDDDNEGNVVDGGDAGGRNLAHALSFPPEIGKKGEFVYLGVLNILSYVVKERSGLSPREYAAQTIFPSLGMNDADIEWWQNEDGMETAFHGLFLTSRQMAKFGQLYLQEGMSGPDERLISAEWVSNSSYPQVDLVIEGAPGSYGYLFWSVDGSWIEKPNTGGFYCALGVGGQVICIHPELDRVAIQQREWKQDLGGNLFVASVAFDRDVNFNAIPDTSMSPSQQVVLTLEPSPSPSHSPTIFTPEVVASQAPSTVTSASGIQSTSLTLTVAYFAIAWAFFQ